MTGSRRHKRIFLSPPHMGARELDYVHEAFASNYIAPVGPQIDAFECEFAEKVGARYAVAVSSGTAALHLVLRYLGVGPGDLVLCSTFSFVASANPVLYCGATPVFVDSNRASWNMDPALLAVELERRAEEGTLPKALVLVHLYGQPAQITPIKALCERYDIALIEDAAEALGAEYHGNAVGTFGVAGFFSFNGNKIITTSGGGMVVSEHKKIIDKIRFWATQARDEALHYEHSEVGYNYRMSNVLAAIGRGQLEVLDDRVARKREIFSSYYEALADLPGVSFMPKLAHTRPTRWLTCLSVDPAEAETDRNKIIEVLEEANIESRPTWKPMHLQPLYQGYEVVGGSASEALFRQGICLPSGTTLTDEDMGRIIDLIRGCWDA